MSDYCVGTVFILNGTRIPSVRRSSRIEVCLNSPNECNADNKDKRYFVNYLAERASSAILYIPRFMQAGIGIQAILRFYLRNCSGCEVDVNVRRDLGIAPLR
jgi:hypothetical protein